eukprot:COSAG02_NODE_7595_length_2943_cov_8.471871_3_plen_188_part_00
MQSTLPSTAQSPSGRFQPPSGRVGWPRFDRAQQRDALSIARILSFREQSFQQADHHLFPRPVLFSHTLVCKCPFNGLQVAVAHRVLYGGRGGGWIFGSILGLLPFFEYVLEGVTNLRYGMQKDTTEQPRRSPTLVKEFRVHASTQTEANLVTVAAPGRLVMPAQGSLEHRHHKCQCVVVVGTQMHVD